MKKYRFIFISLTLITSVIFIFFHLPHISTALLASTLISLVIADTLKFKQDLLGFADIKLLNSLDDIVLIVDTQNIILFQNKKARNLLRTPIRGLFSRRIKDKIAESNYNKVVLHPALKRKENTSEKEEIILTNEHGKTFRAYIKVIRSFHNKTRVKIVLIRQLGLNQYIQNELLKESKEIIESRKKLEMESLIRKDFLDYAAHEFKTPITSIRLCSSMLIKNTNMKKEQIVEYCNMLRKESLNLEKTLTNIMELIRINSNQFKINKTITSLKIIFERVETLFKEKILQKNISILLKLDEGLDNCYIDEERILQTFKNLIDFSINNSQPFNPIIITAKKIERIVHIIIDYSGKTVPDDCKKTIFTNNLKSISGEKVGIDLFISQKIINAHNGRILIEDNIDKISKKIIGARLRITMDIEDEKFKRIVNESDFC